MRASIARIIVMKKTLFPLLLTLSTLACTFPSAFAQAGGGGPSGGNGPGGSPGGKRGNEAHKKSVSAESWLQEQMQQRFAELETKLKLRPEQQAAWLDYQDKIGALNADLSRSNSDGVSASSSALRQIDRKVDVVRNRLTALEDILDAAKRFYQQLDQPQKAVADQLLAGTVPALYSGFWQQQMQGSRNKGEKAGGGRKGKGDEGDGGPPDGEPPGER